MIDLTPLDVRKKREDFRRILRGYDPEEVDSFLELAAERLEELVKENLTLRERTDRLQEQVSSQLGRERAVQEALVTAQELRDDIRGQARQEAEDIVNRAEKEAELRRKEADAEAESIVARANRQLEERTEALKELERQRTRFLRAYRALLEREMDVVEVEEGRTPLEETAVEMEFGRRSGAAPVPPNLPDAAEPGPSEVEPRSPAAPPGGPPPRPEETWREPGSPSEGSPPEGPAPRPDAAEEEAEMLSPADLPDPDALPHTEEDDPKRWLSSLVERELNEKTDEDSWS